MQRKEAAEIFSILKSQLVGAKGRINFNLLNLDVQIKDKSSIGSLLQEWLGAWFKQNKIYFRVQENSQIPPDFFLHEDDTTGLLEIKVFDYSKSPNFDLANFDMYLRLIKVSPEKLDADYLVFGYTSIEGDIIIKEVWLKKIWEMSSASGGFPLKVQVKQGIIHNIRPFNFKSFNYSGDHPAFTSKTQFVNACYNTLAQYKGQEEADDWLAQYCLNSKSNPESIKAFEKSR